MGQMITKPDTNPIIIALAQFFFFIGYFLMGQKKKWIMAIVITIATNILTCATLGWVPLLIFVYDGYLIAQKLQSGQSVGENENGLDFLNKIFKD